MMKVCLYLSLSCNALVYSFSNHSYLLYSSGLLDLQIRFVSLSSLPLPLSLSSLSSLPSLTLFSSSPLSCISSSRPPSFSSTHTGHSQGLCSVSSESLRRDGVQPSPASSHTNKLRVPFVHGSTARKPSSQVSTAVYIYSLCRVAAAYTRGKGKEEDDEEVGREELPSLPLSPHVEGPTRRTSMISASSSRLREMELQLWSLFIRDRGFSYRTGGSLSTPGSLSDRC